MGSYYRNLKIGENEMKKTYLAALSIAAAFSVCVPVAFAEEGNNTYSLVQNVYGWGSGYSKVIVPVDFGAEADYMDADNYKVSVERYDVNNELIGSGERVVTAAYRSDAEGKCDVEGDYVTLDMAVTAENPLASPYYTDPNSFMSTLKAWADCQYTVENTETGESWAELETVYHPDEELFQNDVFAEGEVDIPYAFYEPEEDGETHPLVVWLHGAGSGGNDIGFVTGGMKVTNFVTDEVQDIFGGAYILMPQSETVWMDNGNGEMTTDGSSEYTTTHKALIDTFVSEHNSVDTNRIYVGGCSNGGYMTVKLALEYPDAFAAIFPVCEAYNDSWITDEEIASIASVPTWLVHCTADPLVDINETALPLYERLQAAGSENVHFTVYEEITDPEYGNAYSGHFAWIYSLENMCTTDYDGSPVTVDGEEVNLYQWVAAQSK